MTTERGDLAPANPLSPTSYLRRAGVAYACRPAIIDGDRVFTYGEFLDRSRRLTGLLADLGIERGDRVAALCTNSHLLLELHNGIPMRGGVLVPLNIRLAAAELRYILDHSGASALFATVEHAERARDLGKACGIPIVVEGPADTDYEGRLAVSPDASLPVDGELSMLAINYTSGTTGVPKGVMYSHRGAALQAIAMAFHTGLQRESRYLWTLPMFHCNGWCFTWGVTAAGAVHHCLRTVDPDAVWEALRSADVTHFSAAPTVLSMIAASSSASRDRASGTIRVQTGGAPPSPALLAALARLDIDVLHLYGLTETYGPIVINDWDPAWNDASVSEQARLRARQGVGNVLSEPPRVVDDEGRDVPTDGSTIGEIVVRGSNVMLGYYRDPEGTRAATIDGWLRTGDLAVVHPDGYLEIRDRSKDIIISGGENIASVEVERAIEDHPAVLEAAVVGMPDEKWGQLPVAFVTLCPGKCLSEADVIAHVRGRLAGFKTPRRVFFEDLPKTSTGKIRKNELRDRLTPPPPG